METVKGIIGAIGFAFLLTAAILAVVYAIVIGVAFVGAAF